MTDAELSKALAQVTPQAIVTVIDEMLLLQRAKELGYVSATRSSIRCSRPSRRTTSSRATFEAALKGEGITLAQLRQMLTKRMLDRPGAAARDRRPHRRDRGGGARVLRRAPRRVRDDAERDAARDPVNAKSILSRRPSVGALDDAKEKVEAIRARVVKGESFDKLAAELSDSPSKANGGLIGPISRDEMNEELLKMLSKMKVGDVTPVINTATGAQIFKLESSIDSTTLPFEAARDRLPTESAAEDQRRIEEVHSASSCSGDHRVEERGPSQGVGNRYCRRTHVLMPSRKLVRYLDEVASRAGRARADRAQASRRVPSDHHKWSRWKDRKKKIDWPLFPGYCFARFNPEESLAVLKCTGVVNIVSFEGKPAPIPEHEIDGIRRLVQSDLQYDPCPLIQEGMMVEVTHGALKGVVGPLDSKGAHARLVLSVELIGQGVSVEVDAADVKPY